MAAAKRAKSKSGSMLLALTLIAIIFVLDKYYFVHTSLAVLYLIPLYITSIHVSLPVGVAVMVVTLDLGIYNDPYITNGTDLLIRYGIIGLVFLTVLWNSVTVGGHLEAVEREREKLQKTNLRMEKMTFEIVEALVETIEAKDEHLIGHSKNVAHYCRQIAMTIGLNKEETQNLIWAAYLHDVGKISVDKTILNKPGALSYYERKQIEKHAELGAKIVEKIPTLKNIVPSILHHHEHFDGNGYPGQLKEMEIPLGARIIAVADAFDAMTSDRSFRNRVSVRKAIKELQRCKGTQFDPQIVDSFLKQFDPEFLDGDIEKVQEVS